MADKEIWKFNEFDGGINSHTNPKDIQSKEFVEMNDCSISKTGIIKTIGHCLKDDEITPYFVESNLLAGKGFYSYFTDYTFNPINAEFHTDLEIATETEADDGAYPYIVLYPSDTPSCLMWLFDIEPTAGELRAVLKVNDVKIHGQTDGSGTYLTCFRHASDWSTLNGLLTSDSTDGTSVNLFGGKAVYSYGYSEERWSSISTGNEFSVFNDTMGFPTKAGNWYSKQSTWDWGSSHDDGSYPFIIGQLPNYPWPTEVVDGGVPTGMWDIWFEGNNPPIFFWDYSEAPDSATSQWYLKWNDNRHIFGLTTNNSGYYGIGYMQGPNDFQDLNDDFPLGPNGNEHLPASYFNLDAATVSFPTLDYSQNEIGHGPYSPYVGEIPFFVAASIWKNFIRAINAFSGTGGAGNQFTAEWLDYNYTDPIDGTINAHKHYTDNAPYDGLRIIASEAGATLNGKKLEVELTADSLNNSAVLINAATPPIVDTTVNTYTDSGSVDWSINDSTEFIPIHRDDCWKFRIGDFIQIDSEYMLVTESGNLINETDTNVYYLRVARPWDSNHWIYIENGGTVVASHTEASDIKKFKINPMYQSMAYHATEFDEDYFISLARRRQVGEAFTWGGMPVFQGGLATASAKYSVTLSGEEYTGDIINARVSAVSTATSSIPDEQIVSVVVSTTLAVAAENLKSALDGITGLTGTRDGTKVIVESDTAGTLGDFVFTAYRENINTTDVRNLGVDEEFSVLLSEHPTYDSDSGHFGVGYFSINFDIFSKIENAWNPTALGFDLGWSYHTSIDSYKSNPLMWDEGSSLRFTETNFNLLNPNKSFGWYDLSKWWRGDYSTGDEPTIPWSGLSGQGDAEGAYSKGRFMIVNGEKKWTYTCGILGDDPDNGTFGSEVQGPDGTNDVFNGGLWQATYNKFHDGSNWNEAPAMRFFFDKSDADSGGIDWQGTTKFYAAAVYDDGGDGIPAHQFTIGTTHVSNLNSYTMTFGELTDEETLGEPNGETLRIFCAMRPMMDGKLCFPDERITGIRLYYTHSEENFETFWSLGLIDFKSGFIRANEVLNVDQVAAITGRIVWQANETDNLTSEGAAAADVETTDPTNSVILYDINSTKHYAEYISMPKTQSFENINGYSPYNATLSVRYKAHCIAGRRSFVANIAVPDINGDLRYYNDRMVVSPVNLLDTFPYPTNVIDLDISDGDEIIALQSIGDKILQFKKNMLYIVNVAAGIPAEFFVEERYRFKGVSNINHAVETEDGIFWVNEFGAYLYDGSEDIKDLHFNDNKDKKQRIISQTEWSDFLSEDSLVGYSPKSKEAFVVKTHTQSTKTDGDAFVYSFNVNAWTFAKNKFFVGASKKTTNFQNIGPNDKLGFLYDGAKGAVPGPDGDGSPL